MKETLEPKIYFELLKQAIESNKEIYFKVEGHSMYPFLYLNDKVLVKKGIFKNLKKGDIIVFYRIKNLVIHRIVKIKKNNIITKGDKSTRLDLPIRASDLLGKVVLIKNKKINIETRTWQIINYIVAIYSLSTGLIYQKVCSIKRTFIGNRNNCFINFASKNLRFFIFLPPKLFINFIFFAQTIKFKLKPNTA